MRVDGLQLPTTTRTVTPSCTVPVAVWSLYVVVCVLSVVSLRGGACLSVVVWWIVERLMAGVIVIVDNVALVVTRRRQRCPAPPVSALV